MSAAAFALAGAGGARADDAGKAADVEPAGPRVTWREDGVDQEAVLALDRVAVVEDGGRGELHVSRLSPPAGDAAEYGEALLRRAGALETDGGTNRVVGAVLYQGEPDRATRLVAVGDVLVRFSPGAGAADRRALTDPLGLRQASEFAFADDTYLFRTDDPLAGLAAAKTLDRSPLVEWAVPSFLRPRAERTVPDDPLFSLQWHLRNTGQRSGTAGFDINVTSVWDETIAGVPLRGTPNEVIAIADDGVEIGHPDLAANVVPGRSWDWADADGDPSPSRSRDDAEFHGTACAGVAAARGFNALGVSGAAPAAGLVGYKFLIGGVDSDAVEAEVLAAVRPDPGSRDVIDIINNSWGPVDDRHLEGPGPLAQAALEDGVTNGRRGLGLVYVWAAGNGREDDDNVNFDGFANSRYTIAVGSLTNSGVVAPYSEDGACLTVVAPSSDGAPGTLRDITTVDVTGSAGYDSSDYDSGFGGTSASAPLVSGVVALMLQANPDLTWRDVQAILMTTARKVDAKNGGWTTNAAGHDVSHTYGFGRVDAAAAVAAAADWQSLPAEQTVTASASPNAAIPDVSLTGTTSSITLGADKPRLTVEYVEVEVTAPHPYWHDLEIVLIAPSGTQSVLAPAAASATSYDEGFEGWRFGSTRHFGESSQGEWRLRVRDRYWDDVGRLARWTLKVYGSPAPPDETPPVTAVTPTRRWWRSTVRLDLRATDLGSNVARTERRLGRSSEGRYVTNTVVRVKVPKRGHRKDGRRYVWYRSFDNSGNEEELRSFVFNIDTRRPTTRMRGRAVVRRGGTAVLRFRVDDPGFSARRAHVYLQVLKRTSGRWRTAEIVDLGWRRTNRDDVYRWRGVDLARGPYKVRIRCRDQAGNPQAAMRSSSLTVR